MGVTRLDRYVYSSFVITKANNETPVREEKYYDRNSDC